ncbi:unnamed protein product, partial [Pylaiella littoralis]
FPSWTPFSTHPNAVQYITLVQKLQPRVGRIPTRLHPDPPGRPSVGAQRLCTAHRSKGSRPQPRPCQHPLAWPSGTESTCEGVAAAVPPLASIYNG